MIPFEELSRALERFRQHRFAGETAAAALPEEAPGLAPHAAAPPEGTSEIEVDSVDFVDDGN
jgi:hypothetical protein